MIYTDKIKNKTRILAVCLLGTAFTMTGCKKFLSHDPDSRINLSSKEDLSLLLSSAYPQADYQTFTESASDNVGDKGFGSIYLTYRQNTDAFQFRENIESVEQGSPTYYWKACYKAIAAANQALDVIEKSSDPASFNVQRGEALLCRAYAHFQLVSLFSKSYDPATAASDMGIHYVTDIETTVMKNYERKTVEYVYGMVEKDMLAGLPLLDESAYLIKKYHFTKDAAYAFASRYYLFKRDYAQSLSYAKKVLGGTDLFNAASPTNFQSVRDLTIQDALAFQNRATESSRLLLAEARSDYGYTYYSMRYGLTSPIKDEIFGSWFKANVTGSSFGYPWYTGGGENNAMLRYYPYERRTSVATAEGEYYVVSALFTVEEVIFNIIENNIQLGNYPAVLTDLNKYAKFRMSDSPAPKTMTTASINTFYKTTDTKAGLLKAMLDLKRGEFCQMGLRWFDIIRHGITYQHVPLDASYKVIITANDLRKTFQLPLDTKYSNLPLNPR